MYPHRIRLSSPWRLQLAQHAEQSVRLPAPVPAGSTIRRSFGLPRRVDDFERVWIVSASMTDAHWQLNGSALVWQPVDGSLESDVTSHLKPRNELAATFDETSTLLDSTAIEVRCTAFLRSVVVERSSPNELKLSGLVVGSCESTLELYVLVDGHNKEYRVVSATEAGSPFKASIPIEPELSPRVVMIDLIRGASIWWRHESVIPQ